MRKLFSSPALILFFLSPVLGELVSGSSPPAEFFSFFGLTLMCLLYGAGTLIVRELVVRWGKGWPSIFALGAAYGIAEEGLMCKSFFNPNWPDFVSSGGYGRWAGVNWVWSLNLTIYHMLFSVSIPILLVGLISRDRLEKPWLSRKGFIWMSVLFTADVLFGLILMDSGDKIPYRPPVIPTIAAVIAILLLYRWAKRLPKSIPPVASGTVPKPFWLGAIGFALVFLFFGASGFLSQAKSPIPAILAVVSLLAFLIGRKIWTWTGSGWSDRHALALASGALGFFIMLDFIWDFKHSTQIGNPAGMAVVGLAMILFLFWIRLARTAATPVKPEPPRESTGS